MRTAFIFAALHHKFFLHSADSDFYTPSMSGITSLSRELLEPGVDMMGYTASWTFATMLAFGFVMAILLGML